MNTAAEMIVRKLGTLGVEVRYIGNIDIYNDRSQAQLNSVYGENAQTWELRMNQIRRGNRPVYSLGELPKFVWEGETYENFSIGSYLPATHVARTPADRWNLTLHEWSDTLWIDCPPPKTWK